jgi:general secretion pathway protein D
LIGLLAGNLALVAGPLLAAPQWELALLLQAGGDFSLPASQSAKQQTEQFLLQAKRAIQEQRLDEAEDYIRQAEGTAKGISSNETPPLYSVQQARRDLDAVRKPASDNRQSALGFSAQAGQTDTKQQGSALLRDARRSLARGDVQTADKLCQQAAALKALFVAGEDSPEIVNKLIVDHGKASQMLRDGAPQATRAVASHLLRQAEGMMQYRDYEVARALAQQADRLEVEYQPNEKTPQQMMELLENMRAVATIRPQGGPATATAKETATVSKKEQASRLIAEATLALRTGDLQKAADLSGQASALDVPDSEFGENEIRPWALALDVRSALLRQRNAAVQADYQQTDEPSQVNQAAFMPEEADTGVIPASNTVDDTEAVRNAVTTSARKAYDAGMEALQRNDREAALEHFRSAWQKRLELPDDMQQKLQNQLVALQSSPVQSSTVNDNDLQRLQAVDSEQNRLFQSFTSEVFRVRSQVEDMVANKQPREGLNQFFMLRDRVQAASLNPVKKKQLLTVVDREINELEQYIELNISQIQNDETNNARKKSVDDRQSRKTEIDQQIQQLVSDFEKLVDEHRYAEAEMVARQAYELAPELDVVQALIWKAKFIKRQALQMDIRDRAEVAFDSSLTDVDQAKIANVGDRRELLFPAAEEWDKISRNRINQMQGALGESVEDIRLRNLLRSVRVNLQFNNMPLSEVVNYLSQQAGVNILLDDRALAEQGVTRDSQVSVNLPTPVSLESGLSLILQSLNLTYMVKNEAVQVTSKERRDRNTVKRTYYVADLVIPIPNFAPTENMSLTAAINNSLQQAAFAANSLNGNPSKHGYQTPSLATNVPESSSVLGQVQMPGSPPGGMGGGMGFGGGMNGSPMMGSGAGGGGIIADFDPLMELIRTTIAPETWDEMGGTGTMSEFSANLSLVISNTQEVHEQIQSLLDQLRRLQDLQITIEVRFITLSDDFFERIGIDFDFNIEDNSGLVRGALLPDRVPGKLITGLQTADTNPKTPTTDNDIQFTQGSFSTAVPPFGGSPGASAANLGFAILSDIEVFFLLQASKGDTRTNVLQAPKVTLFNGQTATVADQQLRPFVTSVIPVVGDFAAAHQPVITVLSEGTSLTVNAVATSDRRFVRLTLIPFFSQIKDVDEFTFTGSRTTSTGTNVLDPIGGKDVLKNDQQESIEGTTVQLPVFAITTINTTVNVPDGGTVLLGGIKRLSEGRNESGVPFLSNLPYVNRLFKNVGIGRTSQSLMMMVTPRIIIQEEEEQKQIPGLGN